MLLHYCIRATPMQVCQRTGDLLRGFIDIRDGLPGGGEAGGLYVTGLCAQGQGGYGVAEVQHALLVVANGNLCAWRSI